MALGLGGQVLAALRIQCKGDQRQRKASACKRWGGGRVDVAADSAPTQLPHREPGIGRMELKGTAELLQRQGTAPVPRPHAPPSRMPQAGSACPP